MSDLPVDPRLILGHILDGLLVVDRHGRILWTNEVFRRMIGREHEDLAGRSCCELQIGAFCKEHCPVVKGEGGACASVEAHFNVQVHGTEGRGEPGAYCFVTTPVRDAAGHVIGYMENFRGMDRVRDVILQLEEVAQAIDGERRKAEDLVNSLADGVFSVDRELRVRSFSRSMEEMLAIEAADAVGRPCREVLRGTLCDTDCPLLWSREHGSPVTGCREELRTADGRAVPVTISTGFLGGKADFEHGLFGVVTDRSEVEQLRHELEQLRSFHGMVGKSAAMRALYAQIQSVAPSDATVLITGESGTGKELVARAIHASSQRARGPFVSVNCAALAQELLESELFGHVRGAFTGALRDRRGKFEQAQHGTLFLDEVGDTSPALQAKLLRAIQERTIEPVGSEAARRVDVRILAATNKHLEAEVAAGRFRDDLYYRLNVIPVHVPALRERAEDVPLLVQHFLAKNASQAGAGGPRVEGISERALALLIEYPWPGNVRELEHAIEYATITSTTNRIERAFLPLPLRRLARGPAGPEALAPAADGPQPDDRTALVRSLEAHRWNVGRTAAALGVSRTTLWRRMRALGVRRDAP